jgi:ABC-type phosphate transport system ATPase subunit
MMMADHAAMTGLHGDDLSLAYDGSEMIHQLSVNILLRQITAMIGPSCSQNGHSALTAGVAERVDCS